MMPRWIRWLSQQQVLPRIHRRVAHPARLLWERFLCTFIRCGWWCYYSHGAAGRGGKAAPRLLLAAGVAAVGSTVWVLT